ncbi:MAG: hypothetical protein GOV02_01855 [Candidatus Aenigmarchaeota archaeon]|nr:hypothetical protein [Candidatus Aenigmarchaeota archaeon]
MDFMTQDQVNNLPVRECPIGAYEHIKENFTCPTCYTPLGAAKTEHHSTDRVTLPEVISATSILAAGCPKCEILYRFENDPITTTRVD